MNLKVGIVGLPNAGPSRILAVREGYVLASQERVFGAQETVITRIRS